MKVLILFFTLFTYNVGHGQVSQKAKKYASDYSWNNFLKFYNTSETYDSLEDYVGAINIVSDKDFDSVIIIIYKFIPNLVHISDLLLVEKKHKNLSEYGVIRHIDKFTEIEVLRLFFLKYNFPDCVVRQCSDLLLDNQLYRDFENPPKFNEDSLFNDHR